MSRQRPTVTWKVAATLDNRVAAADGSSRWITGDAARQQVQRSGHNTMPSWSGRTRCSWMTRS